MPRPSAPSEHALSDIRFSCPRCEQSLVVDASGAGAVIDCPGCRKPIQIPEPAELDPHFEELLDNWRSRARDLDAELKEARTQLASLRGEIREKEKESAEAVQQLHAQAAA